MPAEFFLSMASAGAAAAARTEQTVALLQTIEAIRMYGAVHGSQLPPTLDDLPVPAPEDPIAGKPLVYEFLGDRATLSCYRWTQKYQFTLRFAEGAKQ